MNLSSYNRLAIVIITTILCLALVSPTFAAFGDLDTTFDEDGKVTTPFPIAGKVTTTIRGIDTPVAALQQADGKMVVVAEANDGSGLPDIGLVRYHADGSLDTSFDEDGKALSTIRVEMGAFHNGITPADADLLSDNRIVVAGKGKVWVADAGGSEIMYDNSLVALFAQDGSLDTSFNIVGYDVPSPASPANSEYTAVVVQPDDKIVVARFDQDSFGDFTLVRYNTDGTLDTTFDTDGIVSTPCGGTYMFCAIEDLAVQTVSGVSKIIVLGSAMSISDPADFILMRYNMDGTLDSTFGSSGITTTNFGALGDGNAANALAIQADGKILAAGDAHNGIDYDFALARYTVNGTLDTSFDSDGKMVSNFSGDDEINGIALQADGSIIVSGNTGSGMKMARYSNAGVLDGSFNVSGLSDYWNNFGVSALIQPSGRIIGVGYFGNREILLVGLNNDGSYDNAFGLEFGKSDAEINAVALQPDGKILAAGYSVIDTETGDKIFSLARYNADGSMDTSFDGDGRIITSFGEVESNAYAVAVQPDGKILVAGHCWDAGTTYRNIALARYNSDGSLDTSFDSDGLVIASTDKTYTWIYAMALQSDGKIILGGQTYEPGESDQLILIRYNANGTLDTTFGTNGITITSIETEDAYIRSIALQADGKILAAGTVYGPSRDFVAARYTASGVLDASFGVEGVVITDFGGDETGRAVALQSDGKFIVGGYKTYADGRGFALARYNSDGSLDTTFDTDGKITDYTANRYDMMNAMLVQVDGKILAAGSSFLTSTNDEDFILVKYNTDGSLDTSFSVDGKVTVNFNASENESANALVQQTDGSLILAGSTMYDNDYGQQTDFALARVENELGCLNSITVTNANDSGPGSLRQAISDVCAGGTITFAGDTSILLETPIHFEKGLTISGEGRNIIIDGGDSTRLFEITGDGFQVFFDYLTLTGGNADSGGAINLSYSGGLNTLTITNSTIHGNHATTSGGAIWVNYSTLQINNSTFYDNSTDYVGGVIYSNYGPLVIENNTFTNNRAPNTTGGYSGVLTLRGASLTLLNNTFVGNQAYSGANLSLYYDPTLTVSNNIFANGITAGGLHCACGDFLACNIGGITNVSTNDQCGGTVISPSLAVFAPLGNYGGDTQTMPLLPGNPAIDSGESCLATDQRSLTRSSGPCDVGAFESQGFTLESLTGTSQSTNINTAFANPLGLTVTANDPTEPVDGGIITFTSPSSGASAFLNGNPAIIADGMVSVSITANDIPGVYNVTASAAGATDVNFALTNIATYTVTYDGNGSTGGNVPIDSFSPYTESGTVTVLDNTGSLVRTGYTFVGWNTKADGTGTNYAADDTFLMPAENVVLYAQWTVNQNTLIFLPVILSGYPGGK